MKILHILDHSIPLHSGYTFRTRAILQAQRDMGWETFHVTSSKHLGAKLSEEEVDGYHFFRTDPAESSMYRFPGLNYVGIIRKLQDRIEEICQRIQPDVLHAHSPALNGIAAVQAGRRLGLPVVYECRAFWEDAAVDHGTSREGGIRYQLTRHLESYVFRKADAVTTICEGLRAEIISRGIPDRKITVIPNAVDVERFPFMVDSDEMLKSELGLVGKQVLGFIGSFYAYEGLPLLLEAMPEILKQRPDVRLVLVGGGPQEQVLHEKVRQLGLEDAVIFTGRVPHDQVQRYYNLVDLFVYPRLSMRLTDLVTPLKPLEAMAQGKLVVASDVGGHLELIRDQETGVLFRSNDVNSLVESVCTLLNRPEQWGHLRQNGRTFVEEERNWPYSVDRYRQVYASAKTGQA